MEHTTQETNRHMEVQAQQFQQVRTAASRVVELRAPGPHPGAGRPAGGARAQVGGCKSPAAASTKGFGRALGEQEAVQDAGEEEAGAESSTERLEEPSAGGRDRARVASPGQPDVQYEEEEKSAEFSDAWWIASDRAVLPKFSLFEHELRSHVPFSSSCEICVRARGLKKARHRTEVHQNEVQLDQFWHGSLRFLILVHSKSFAIGCVSGDGPREAVVAGMSQWLMHFGLANKDCLFTCDAEGYMRTLWQQLLQDFPSFQGTIEQFAAGRHAPVAERGVRALRETASGILLQMQDNFVALRNNRKAFSLLFGHACAVHNRYNVMSGSMFSTVAKVERKPTQAPPSVYFRRNSTCCTPAKQGRSSHRSICVWVLSGGQSWEKPHIGHPFRLSLVLLRSCSRLPSRCFCQSGMILSCLACLQKGLGALCIDVLFCQTLIVSMMS